MMELLGWAHAYTLDRDHGSRRLVMEQIAMRGVSPHMNDVTVSKRRRSFEWRVHDRNGTLMFSGRERTRPAARYQGYRHLFMLLAIGRRAPEVRTLEIFPTSNEPDAGASPSWTSSARPKTGQSR
ncbi:hypothetical protein CQ14_21495 [Bradyrhizobium lablabi]|uniref:Uncharacterized protein n=1 Tax=Bradyrhizobium lablabi TaxID=722472 RepID=A0A0R3N1L7_9BRAD|nr:hypothetical protein CQ14_21495 [Bradyrhizobium lablabi]